MLRSDEATYLSIPFKLILSERLSNSLSGSDAFLYLEFSIASFFYNFIEFITFLYIFFVISFAQ